ncbi:unnamed protein product [Boreogadus saida]
MKDCFFGGCFCVFAQQVLSPQNDLASSVTGSNPGQATLPPQCLSDAVMMKVTQGAEQTSVRRSQRMNWESESQTEREREGERERVPKQTTTVPRHFMCFIYRCVFFVQELFLFISCFGNSTHTFGKGLCYGLLRALLYGDTKG